MRYIGLDVGTSGCKAAIVDGQGAIYATAKREYSFEMPASGYAELDPALVWNAVLETLSEIGPRSGGVAALAVSSIGESLVMLDRDDKPLAKSIIYLDARGKDILPYIAGKIDARELFAITGMHNHRMYSLCRFLWYRKNTPSVIENADKICMFCDFLNYQLTGKRALDPGSASRSSMFNAKKREWSASIMDLFAIPQEKFSPVAATGAIIGNLLPQIARTTGLPKDLQVVLGCHDQCSATLGAGVLDQGQIMLGEGSTEGINAIIKTEHIDEDALFKKQISLEPYISPDTYIAALGTLQHGTAIQWFVQNNAAFYDTKPSLENETLFAKADRYCAENSGELYFIPYLSRSNIMDTANQALGCFIGLEFDSTVNTMYCAVLEGLAFETKYNMLNLEQSGYTPEFFAATGGGAKSALLMQIKADVLDCAINIPQSADSGIVGLAMICAVAMGEYHNYREAAERFIKIKKTFNPQTDCRMRCNRYIQINRTIKKLYDVI
ncbi:MAG: hypothetical protein LBD18_02805 [Treponema sp.]|jgi:xylulokinase|nr:hypothetical protein [Treponema sp.]